MKIASWNDLIEEQSSNLENRIFTERQDLARKKIEAEYQISFSRCMAVKYDTKTDRYVATFAGGPENSSMKVSNDVAVFLLKHIQSVAQPHVKVKDGTVIDVLLTVLT